MRGFYSAAGHAQAAQEAAETFRWDPAVCCSWKACASMTPKSIPPLFLVLQLLKDNSSKIENLRISDSENRPDEYT